LHDGMVQGFFFDAEWRKRTLEVVRTGHHSPGPDGIFTVF
jgi:hypothetical protein